MITWFRDTTQEGREWGVLHGIVQWKPENGKCVQDPACAVTQYLEVSLQSCRARINLHQIRSIPLSSIVPLHYPLCGALKLLLWPSMNCNMQVSRRTVPLLQLFSMAQKPTVEGNLAFQPTAAPIPHRNTKSRESSVTGCTPDSPQDNTGHTRASSFSFLLSLLLFLIISLFLYQLLCF